MNTPNQDLKVVENSAYNPFPEPQTIPRGWDLSGIFISSSNDSEMDQETTEN